LLRLNVDLIVTRGSRHVQPLKEATSAIPIVFLIHANPVGLGHVASLAKPGGNITGLSDFAQDTEAKRLELLKEVDPRIERVAVLWNPDIPSHAPRLQALEEAVRTLPFKLTAVAARSAAEFDRAFASIAQERAQAVIVLSAPDFNAERRRLAELALRYRLPTMFGPRQHVDAGGLMSYYPHLADLFRRGASYVDKILKGAKPADLPVEQPTKFELVINLKTAEALGITIPPMLLFQADEVIK
jgi:putative ABC transport system substrate-binding protein